MAETYVFNGFGCQGGKQRAFRAEPILAPTVLVTPAHPSVTNHTATISRCTPLKLSLDLPADATAALVGYMINSKRMGSATLQDLYNR